MELIGLTGGIGSGKSTVAGVLRELGATVIDADAAARAVVEPGTQGFRQVVDAFGDSYVKQGRLDRPALADLVFNDDAAREKLNSITHPLVREWMFERQQEAEGRGEPRVVLEIPLLYENRLDAAMTKVIVVAVPEATQVLRLRQAHGYSEEHARARIAAQLPLDEKVRRANYVIDNSGPVEKTRQQVHQVWREIVGQTTR